MRPSEALAKHRDAIIEVLARYPLTEPRLFGSTARGEDDEASDLDILVRHTGPIGYLSIAKLELELEQLTGMRVDIRTEGEFGANTSARIRKDSRPL